MISQTAYVACGNGGVIAAFTVATGAALSSTALSFNPHGIALSKDGGMLYVADWGDCEIHTVALTGNDVSNTRDTIAGLVSGYTGTHQNGNGQASGACSAPYSNGFGTNARFGRLNAALMSQDGHTLYVTDGDKRALRSIGI